MSTFRNGLGNLSNRMENAISWGEILQAERFTRVL